MKNRVVSYYFSLNKANAFLISKILQSALFCAENQA